MRRFDVGGSDRRASRPELGDRGEGLRRERSADEHEGLDSGSISAAIVGLEVGSLTRAIDARWLMAYAAALGETDARYFDTTRPPGPAAHPLFSVCYEWPLLVEVRDRALGERVARLGVHASHRLVIHRPPRAGDELTTTARVTAVAARRSGTLVVVRLITVDRAGDPVTTTEYGSVYRGVATDAAASSADVRKDAAAGDGRWGAESQHGGDVPWNETGDVRWSEGVDVSAQLAHVYTECARIWNPIHTDLAVALAAGLPGPILHGTATLALAVSRIVDHDLGGDPGAVRSVAARFTGRVPLPSSFTVRARGRRGDTFLFDAVAADGAPVLSQGALTR